MILDAIKARLWPAATLALFMLLALANWKIDSLEEELSGLKVVIDVQDNAARLLETRQQGVTNELTQKISRDAAIIRNNRLLHTADKARADTAANSTPCNNEPIAPADTDGSGQGFRDQAVDVAIQLTYCQSFLTENNFPVAKQ